MSFVLGVDGGNTKTVALIASYDGRIVGYGRGGCGDIFGSASEEDALEQIDAAVDGALTIAGLERRDLSVACFCLAGADWPEDFTFLRGALRARGLGLAERLIVANDGQGALRAGSDDGTGVVITCGTGLAVAARHASGAEWHSGFWAEPLCGNELGRRTLRAVYRAELGIAPPTSLTDAVLQRLARADVPALLRRFEGRDAKPPTAEELNGLVPLLLDAAEAGDATARAIVSEHGARLAEYGAAAARKVGLDVTSCPLVLNGGVFRHPGSLLEDAVLERLGRPSGTSLRGGDEPAVGAVLLGMEALGIELRDEVRAALRESLPPPELYASHPT